MFEIQEYPVGYLTTSNFIVVSGITSDIRRQANTHWFFNVLSQKISPLSCQMFDVCSSKLWLLLVGNMTYAVQEYEFFLSNVRQFFCKNSGLCRQIRGMVCNFFTLAYQLSDGLTCHSYGILVGRGHKPSENRWDGVIFAMSSHRWFDNFSCRIFGNLAGCGHQSSKMRRGIV